jgi:hypothetical protein
MCSTPPGTLFRLDPFTYFHETKFEQAHIDNIADVLTDLNTVTNGEGLADENEYPAGNTGDKIFERDNQTGTDKADKT